MKVKRATVAAIMIFAMGFSLSAQEKEILVSAAASLTDVLTALKPEAEEYIDASIVINFAGSGTLRAQIEQGAPVDVFFSAASADVDKLEASGLIIKESRKDLLSNAIVLVGDTSLKAPATIGELRALLASVNLLAIGNPDSVPAGRYAVQALKSLDLYSTVEKKLVYGNNVRQVLQFVESSSVPVGIVFLTDAATVAPKSSVTRLYIFPDTALQTPILYPVAIVTGTKNPTKAAKLIEFFQSDAARRAFTQAGFITK